jgi:hypothetical protein
MNKYPLPQKNKTKKNWEKKPHKKGKRVTHFQIKGTDSQFSPKFWVDSHF